MEILSKKILTSHGFMYFGKEITKLFFSIYIWKMTNSLAIVALFNIALNISHIITFFALGNIVKKGNILTPIRVGLSGLIFLLAIFFLLKEQCINYVVQLGILFGIFNGLYWISYHLIRYDLTTSKNRGNYVGSERSVRILGSLTAPVIGGWLIVQNFYGLNYGLVFATGLIAFLFAIIFSNIKYELKYKSELRLKESFKKFIRVPDIRKVFLSNFISASGRGDALTTLIPIFLFSVLNNEFKLGGLLTAFSFIGMIIGFSIGKFFHYKNYMRIFKISSIFFLISLAMLIGFPGLIAFVIFGFVREALDPAISVPKLTYNLNMLHKIKDWNRRKVEYIIFREFFGTTGVVLGYSILFFADSLTTGGIQIILSFMAVAVLLELIVFSSIKSKLEGI